MQLDRLSARFTLALLPSVLGACLLAGLSGCGKEPDSPAAPSESTLTGPDVKPGLAANDGRLVLPVISERPAAVYFTVRNNSAEPVMLAGVHLAGAGKAEMHETKTGSSGASTMSKVESLPITPGASVVFAPGGLHVMAFELADTFKPGSEAELTLTFADGDKLSMPLEVEAMGAPSTTDGHDMEGMRH